MDDRYVAGLFDGEGYVRISRWQKPGSTHIRYNLVVGIGMTHRPVIEALHAEFGGTLAENRHDLRKPNSRIQYQWVAGSRTAYEFLLRVRPYLIVKKDEAEIAIRFQEQIDANPYTPAGKGHLRENREGLLAEREDLYNQIRALKKRSYPPLLASGPNQ